MQGRVYKDWKGKRPFGGSSEITGLLKWNAAQNEGLEGRVGQRLEVKLLFKSPLILWFFSYSTKMKRTNIIPMYNTL